MLSLLLFFLPLATFSFVLQSSSPSWGSRSTSSSRKHIHTRHDSNLDDWRDFRTKLIQSNSNTTSKDVVLDAGYLIEVGSIVLSEVESSLGCHDLNQPYLHKAVVLLLEHDDDKYTKGVLLNRQTDLILADDDIIYLNENGEPMEDNDDDEEEEEEESENDDLNKNRWRMNFGGDLAGLYDENPAIVCLHSLASSALAKKLSETVMPGIYFTSHASARLLISLGEANTSDFFVCFGFCGWDPGQLRQELKRGSWSMVSTTSADTIWNELQQQQQQLGMNDEQKQQPLVVIEPRTAGLHMWESFRKKVGKDPAIGKGSFSDLMLKEW
jgi:putative AlgH/UPF0301 family transcriptional regulator